jgi:hypothetical protein
VNPLDWAILGVGLLVLIFSFFGYYHGSVEGSGIISYSASYSAWHEIFGGGFVGWFGIILAIVGAIFLALDIFAPGTLKLPAPIRLVALGLFALGFIFELLALVAHPKFTSESGAGFKVSFGHGFSYWVELILTLAGTVLCLMRLQQTGGKLPGALSKIPNIGGPGSNPPPPPGNYPPPPNYGPPQ